MTLRALVTGASGFIGSTLVEELNTLGFEVRALMRASSSLGNLGTARFEKVIGDLSDAESLRRAVQGVDYVFHLAGSIAAPTREAYFEHNAEGTRKVAEAIVSANPDLKRLVFVSSLAAGGPSSGPIEIDFLSRSFDPRWFTARKIGRHLSFLTLWRKAFSHSYLPTFPGEESISA